MATTTPHAYHTDEDNHGNYQYITLKEIVDGFMLRMQDDDHYLKNTRRYLILEYAKEAISEFNKELKNEVKTMEITVPDKLYFALPHDYVDYARVSLVVNDPDSTSLRLQPLDLNNNINIADGYLQDHIAEILFDKDGYILQADSQNAYNKPYKKYGFTEGCGNPNMDTTKLSRWGEFKIDTKRGKILFSSNLADEEIVMEYVSDGLSADTYNEGEIRISKFLAQAVKDYIFHAAIEHRVSVNFTEKRRALNRFKTTLHKAKLNLADNNLLSISRAMRISSQNI